MFEQERQHMVEKHLKRRDITNQAVLDAMKDVRRHEFVPDKRKRMAYGDFAVPLHSGLTISQPYMVAKMIQLLDVKPSDKVLEVGSGSGYALAVLSRIANKAYGIELDDKLVKRSKKTLKNLGYDNAKVTKGDGSKGLIHHHPYDKILVSAGASEIPEILLEQLNDQGIVVAPIGTRRQQKLMKYTQKDGEIKKEEHESCVFIPLKGKNGMKQ